MESGLKFYRRAAAWAQRKSWPWRREWLNRTIANRRPTKPGVALLGNGRSGTSWIGKMLGSAPNTVYYREPCHPRTSYLLDDTVWSRFVPPDGDDPHFRSCLERAFAGQFVGEGDASPANRKIRASGDFRVVVKEVACFISLEWLYRHWAPEIVIVTRHPCPSVASVRKLVQAPIEERRYRELISNPLLRDKYFGNLATHLERVKGPVEVSAAIWAIKNFIAYEAYQRHSEWQWISYEAFCLEPLLQFEALYGRLGLCWTDQVKDAITRSTTTQVAGAHATSKLSRSQVDRWRETMTVDEIETVRRVVEPFDLPFYRNAEDWL